MLFLCENKRMLAGSAAFRETAVSAESRGISVDRQRKDVYFLGLQKPCTYDIIRSPERILRVRQK